MHGVELLLVHLGWLPLLLVLFWVFYKERYPIPAALLAYFLGGFATLPAWVLQVGWRFAFLGHDWAHLWDMPLWIVPVEEAAKLASGMMAFSALGCVRCRSFFPLALSAGLGFAGTESAIAVMVWGLDVMPLRLLVSVPGHVLFTALAAIGVAGCQGSRPRWRALIAWWLLAVATHAAYNTILLHHPDSTALDAFLWLAGLAVGCVALARYRFRARTVDSGAGSGDHGGL